MERSEVGVDLAKYETRPEFRRALSMQESKSAMCQRNPRIRVVMRSEFGSG